MSAAEFVLLRDLIQEHCGIALGDSKRELLIARLSRRLRALGLASFAEYYEHLRSRDPRGEELAAMTNCVTTNKTQFFREAHHFQELAARVLRPLAQRDEPIRIWSAGCSTGEEPYTIAITARETLGASAGRVEIVATDIDTEVLAKAEAGVYPSASLDDVDVALQRRHFLRGRGDATESVRVRPELRAMVRFERVNLVEPGHAVAGPFDAIFCRNVMIYFDRATQKELIALFATRLRSLGHLFVGHTENLQWLTDQFEPLATTTHRLKPTVRSEQPAPAAAIPSMERVRIVVGGVYASRKPAEVRTLLGSCVSACIYDPLARVGGMNHFLLADGRDELLPNRYGVHAMEVLINEVMKRGGERSRLEAKVFGGANVLAFNSSAPQVGEQNAAFVRRYLETERIPIVAQRLGGTTPVEVRFETHTARALVRAVDRVQAQTAVRDEALYRSNFFQRTARPASDITMFEDSDS